MLVETSYAYFKKHLLAARNKACKYHYALSNKSGYLSLRVLHPRHAIQCIITANNSNVYKDSEIFEEFHNYYKSLYNLQPARSSSGQMDPTSAQTYISETALPVLSAMLASGLESLLSTIEFAQTIKTLQPGKCPGPDALRLAFIKLLCHYLLLLCPKPSKPLMINTLKLPSPPLISLEYTLPLCLNLGRTWQNVVLIGPIFTVKC